jgi:hypothetical protein
LKWPLEIGEAKIFWWLFWWLLVLTVTFGIQDSHTFHEQS